MTQVSNTDDPHATSDPDPENQAPLVATPNTDGAAAICIFIHLAVLLSPPLILIAYLTSTGRHMSDSPELSAAAYGGWWAWTLGYTARKCLDKTRIPNRRVRRLVRNVFGVAWTYCSVYICLAFYGFLRRQGEAGHH